MSRWRGRVPGCTSCCASRSSRPPKRPTTSATRRAARDWGPRLAEARGDAHHPPLMTWRVFQRLELLRFQPDVTWRFATCACCAQLKWRLDPADEQTLELTAESIYDCENVRTATLTVAATLTRTRNPTLTQTQSESAGAALPRPRRAGVHVPGHVRALQARVCSLLSSCDEGTAAWAAARLLLGPTPSTARVPQPSLSRRGSPPRCHYCSSRFLSNECSQGKHWCPNDCRGKGECVQGVCICQEGFWCALCTGCPSARYRSCSSRALAGRFPL